MIANRHYQTLRCGLALGLVAATLCNGHATVREEGRALRDGLPRFFEPNVGQADPRVLYFARGSGYTLSLTESGPWWTYPASAPKPARSGPRGHAGMGLAVAMRWLGADGPTAVRAASPLQTRVSHLVGPSDAWRSAGEVYQSVRYENVYPGIHLVFRESEGRLEYDWVVRPGADPTRIRVRFDGVDAVRSDDQGRLVLATALGEVRQSAPRSFQVRDDGVRVEIPSRWEVDPGGTTTFALARHDPRRELVIDPVIDAATYLGIPGHLFHFRLAVAEDGSPVVVTEDQTRTLPTTPGVFQPDHNGGRFDLVITRLDPGLTRVDFLTYFGGNGIDDFPAVDIAPDGDIVVAARTQSDDLPTTPGSFQPALGGAADAMLARFAPDLSALRWVTYLGGSDHETVSGVDVGAGGTIAVGGTTGSEDFPLLDAADSTLEGPVFFPERESYVASFDGDGSARWVTYFGGSDRDAVNAVAVAPDGSVTGAGWTTSADLPVQNALWPTASGQEAWIGRWSPSGGAGNLTYYGGPNSEAFSGLARDPAGNLYAIGITNGGSPPDVVPLVPNHDGGFFIVSLTADLQALRYAVQGWRTAFARIGVSDGGRVLGAVDTRAAVFGDVVPHLIDPLQAAPGGGIGDSGLVALDPGGDPTFISLLGDSGWEITTEIAHDRCDALVMTGTEGSTGDLPVTPDAHRLAPIATNDGHLMRLDFGELDPATLAISSMRLVPNRAEKVQLAGSLAVDPDCAAVDPAASGMSVRVFRDDELVYPVGGDFNPVAMETTDDGWEITDAARQATGIQALRLTRTADPAVFDVHLVDTRTGLAPGDYPAVRVELAVGDEKASADVTLTAHKGTWKL